MSKIEVSVAFPGNKETSDTELTASNPTVSAFFKAYTQVSPKLKRAKDKETLDLIEEATSILNKISKSLGKKGKKTGSFNIKVETKSERTKKNQTDK